MPSKRRKESQPDQSKRFIEKARELRQAIKFHVEGLAADGLPVPVPTSLDRKSVV